MVHDDDDSVNYYGHYGGGWVDTDTDSGEEDATGGGSADLDATEGEDAPEDGRDEPATPEDGGDDLDDDTEIEPAADTPPPEPHYKKQVHRLNFAEGPFPALL